MLEEEAEPLPQLSGYAKWQHRLQSENEQRGDDVRVSFLADGGERTHQGLARGDAAGRTEDPRDRWDAARLPVGAL